MVNSVLGVAVVGGSGVPNPGMFQSKFGNEGNVGSQDLKSHSSVPHSEQNFSPAIFLMYQLPKRSPQTCFGSKITLAIANKKNIAIRTLW